MIVAFFGLEKCVALSGAHLFLYAYPALRLRVRSPQAGLGAPNHALPPLFGAPIKKGFEPSGLPETVFTFQ